MGSNVNVNLTFWLFNQRAFFCLVGFFLNLIVLECRTSSLYFTFSNPSRNAGVWGVVHRDDPWHCHQKAKVHKVMMQWLCPCSVPSRLWLLDNLYCLILRNSQLLNYIRISYFIYKTVKQIHFSNSMNIFLSCFFQANSIPFLREPECLAKWKSNSASAKNR